MYVCKKSMTLFSSKPSNPQHCIIWNGLVIKWIQSSYISVKSHWRYGVSNRWQLEYLFNNLLGLIKGWHQSVCSGADQGKYQSAASLAFVSGIHRWPVNSPHQGPITRKMLPFDDVIMLCLQRSSYAKSNSISWCHHALGGLYVSGLKSNVFCITAEPPLAKTKLTSHITA